MAKKIIYVIVSVFALGVLLFGVYILNNGISSKSDGEIKIVLVDIENKTVLEKEIEFQNGDSLPILLEENFDNFDFSDGYVKSIGQLSEYSNDKGLYYISLLVDGNYSEKGVSMIELTDGLEITFKMEEYLWQN